MITDPEGALMDAELRKLVDDMLAELLRPREAQIVRLRFGFEGEPCTFAEIGRIMSRSRDRMRQVFLAALRKLRNPRRARELYAYISDARWTGISRDCY